jgi:CheY-like chemotaxis protein
MFTETVQTEIKQVLEVNVPALVEKMPSNSWYGHNLVPDGTNWCFTFKCISDTKTFFAEAIAGTPLQAFLICRHILNSQIREWHQTRFLDSTSSLPFNLFPQATQRASPRVMIVDDDIDTALSMQTLLDNLGCTTDIQTKHQELHRKMISGNTDIILLDWTLNDNVTADKVVKKATKIIDIFSDLQKKYSHDKLKVVTYSSAKRDEVVLPDEVRKYFNHLDHWPKSDRFRQKGLLI